MVGIDQADAALRRKKIEKSSVKKGGMNGGFNLTELGKLKEEIIKLDRELSNISDNSYNYNKKNTRSDP